MMKSWKMIGWLQLQDLEEGFCEDLTMVGCTTDYNS